MKKRQNEPFDFLFSLDELIPHLGIFQKVALMVKERLYDAVYSTNLTSSDLKGNFERLPYFVLVNRMEEIKEESLQEMRSVIHKKDKELDALRKEVHAKRKEIEILSRESRNDKKQRSEMMSEIRKTTMENEKLGRIVTQQQKTQQRMALDMDARMKQIKNSYGNLAVEAEMLGQYKSAYDSLDEGFRHFRPNAPQSRPQKNSMASSSEYLRSVENLEMALTIERQLLNLQNTTLEEYDLKIEDHKRSLQPELMMSEEEWEHLTMSRREFIVQNAEIKAELQQIQHEIERLRKEIPKLKNPANFQKITPTLSLNKDGEIQSEEEEMYELDDNWVEPTFMADPLYSRLWADWKSRNSLPRKLPRPINFDRCSSLAHQFYAAALYDDEMGGGNEPFLSLLDSFYGFLSDRYFDSDAVHLSAYDYMSSLVQYASNDLSLNLLLEQLCGRLDGVCFRYVLLMSDFIDHVEWESPRDFSPFALAVYPFLSEDDIEQMTMSFTAFSENKISKQLVCNYFTYLILKHREPRIVEAESRLLQQPGERPGLLNEIEFIEAVESILPLTPEGIRHRIYKQSEADMPKGLDALPISRLSQILAYLGLLQLAPLIRTSISDKVIEGRTHHQPMSATASSVISKKDFAGGRSFKFVTLAGLKSVAKNLTKWHRKQ
ncbi:uncharacterized protein [Oscarella lobularis]|uniref:uncharacterized protein isoform X2 n=1 Tax=Oscarella lobularis TaxID=121494 RepID=UPI00331397E5